jgi:predicted nucleic acid-binding protein
MRVLLDTSCLVAAALAQHEHHAATIEGLSRRRAAGHTFLMAAHAVTESYAVLTRLPAPHRLAPADAFEILHRNWGRTETIALTAVESWRVVQRHASRGVGGGRVYDGCIAECARKGKAREILTWNVRHFEALSATPAIRVVSP